jgi:hypothetical protein
MADESKKMYPEGHFLSRGIAIGMVAASSIMLPFFIMLDQVAFIGLGPAIGLSLGVALGQLWENKYKEAGQIRPLTDGEKRLSKRNAYFIVAGILVLVALIVFIIWRLKG